MKLASRIEHYEIPFKAKYGSGLLPGQLHAMEAMQRCRTPDAGTVLWHCGACAQRLPQSRSCGHRRCPQCQNHEATQWLERQQAKRLPVEYFMVTFTLPQALRGLAWCHQKPVYDILFATVASTLKDFGLHPNKLGCEIGMTSVLHTHSRSLEYHPHDHLIVPGGGVDQARRQWRKVKGKYLFNEFALAKVFRARFLTALKAEGLPVPTEVPETWVVHGKHLGKGRPALEYLSRYLYRGVIGERHVVADHHGQVTFRYTEGATAKTRYRTLPGEDFLWLVLQHVLPKGFRRVRDYGFLHGNAKRLLTLVQWVLQVVIEAAAPTPRPAVNCPKCHCPMQVIGVLSPAGPSG
jgi:hypothetical protein